MYFSEYFVDIVTKMTLPFLLKILAKSGGEVVLDNGNVWGTAGSMEKRERLLPRQLRSEAFGVRRGVAGDMTGGLRRSNLLGSWELEERLEVFMSEVDEAWINAMVHHLEEAVARASLSDELGGQHRRRLVAVEEAL